MSSSVASTSSQDTSLFGWDLTYATVKNDIKTKEDMLIVLTHFMLVKNDFRCVGVGESMEESIDDNPSEILPSEWNQTSNYALRYTYLGKLYNLVLVKTSKGIVFINILYKGQKISGVEVKLDETIQSLTGSLENIIPSYKCYFARIKTQLIESVIDNKKNSQSTQTADLPQAQQQRSITDFNPRPLGPEHRIERPPWHNPLADPRQVGRADLDPFGQGGGMLFEPPRLIPGAIPGPNFPGIAPGSLPPGARFDPFRPPGVEPPRGPRRPPDSDHFPPPGYDDMFM